jgi:hypothetical protein
MNIIVRKCEVYQEVEKITSVIGSQTVTDSGSLYKQLWASPDDAPVLDMFWRDAASDVYNMFRRYLSSSSVEYSMHESNREEVFVLETETPVGFEENLTMDILNNIKSFFVATVVSGWLALKGSERAAGYASEAVGYGSSIKEKLMFKKEPEQPRRNEPDEDTVKIRKNNGNKNHAS